jgi:hypothetical protein
VPDVGEVTTNWDQAARQLDGLTTIGYDNGGENVGQPDVAIAVGVSEEGVDDW